MNTPAISVIVAAFNAENYLKRCLESISNQSFQSFEVIVIDDGSTDGTAKIAKTFSDADPRFRVYQQENQGVAATRQRGMDLARGEYSIHIDSDDWIDREMLEVMYAKAVEVSADYVFCDFSITHRNGQIEYRSEKPSLTDPVSIFGLFMFDIQASLCNSLMRISLLREHDIRFINNMNIAEDQYLILRLLSHGIKVIHIPKAFYHYDHTQNDESLVNRGCTASSRLLPLELLKDYTDISPAKYYYDRAIFHIAHEYLYEDKALCADYPLTFRPHLRSIVAAKGFPFRNRLFILLRIFHINLPLKRIKSIWKRFIK